MSLNGRATELVRDDDSEVWRPKSDDGTRVRKLQGAANGALGGEHWQITSPDGTQYFFGLDRLTGWSQERPETESTWTVPVFGNNKDEPCHRADFADSWCQQAWRWNLDLVVDPRGNAVTYYYAKETNSYGRNRKATDDTPYVRGGYLRRIEYGL